MVAAYMRRLIQRAQRRKSDFMRDRGHFTKAHPPYLFLINVLLRCHYDPENPTLPGSRYRVCENCTTFLTRV